MTSLTTPKELYGLLFPRASRCHGAQAVSFPPEGSSAAKDSTAAEAGVQVSPKAKG